MVCARAVSCCCAWSPSRVRIVYCSSIYARCGMGMAMPLALMASLLLILQPSAASTWDLPPAGWNAWFAFDKSVTEEGILRNAQALVRTGLAAAGYT